MVAAPAGWLLGPGQRTEHSWAQTCSLLLGGLLRLPGGSPGHGRGLGSGRAASPAAPAVRQGRAQPGAASWAAPALQELQVQPGAAMQAEAAGALPVWNHPSISHYMTSGVLLCQCATVRSVNVPLA